MRNTQVKLVPGIHVIETSFWERPLQLTLVFGRERVTLVDTGSPERLREVLTGQKKSDRLENSSTSFIAPPHLTSYFGYLA
jgi:hypothetical protein